MLALKKFYGLILRQIGSFTQQLKFFCAFQMPTVEIYRL
jgi:hypothetical protein